MRWLAALALTGCVAPAPAALPDPRVPAAVERAIPLLQSSAATWLSKRECTSCHHQALGTMALAVAREAGFALDEARAAKQVDQFISYAASAGIADLESMQLLMDRGADLEDRDADGVSMLMYLAAIGFDEPARRLLARGADVAAADNQGLTPLHYAAMCDPGHTRMVEALLAAGADPSARAKSGETPFDLAERHKNLGAAHLLAAAGPRVTGEPEVPRPLVGILAAHNRLRAKHCAAALTWSPELARTAQRWAERLRKNGCSLEHSRGAYGENLAAATPGSLANEDVVVLWYAEREHYRYNRPGFRSETGHFTQVIWRGTKRLGCGVASCDTMQVWVCNYDPPGNVEGEYRDNVLPDTCSRR